MPHRLHQSDGFQVIPATVIKEPLQLSPLREIAQLKIVRGLNQDLVQL